MATGEPTLLHLADHEGHVCISDSEEGPFMLTADIDLLSDCETPFDVMRELQDVDVFSTVSAMLKTSRKKSIVHSSLTTLPFSPATLRDCSLWMEHMRHATAGMIALKMPALYPVVKALSLVGLDSVVTKPSSLFTTRPTYYMADHRSVLTEDTMPYPHTDALDFELELCAVIVKEIRDATPEDAAAAIGGFILMNDFSCRDSQLPEMRAGLGIPASKNCGTALAKTVAVGKPGAIPALIESGAVYGQVAVKSGSETRAYSGTSAGMTFSVAETIACISSHSVLREGDVIGLGTIPGCSVLETDRAWLKVGDVVAMETKPCLGSLRNVVGDRVAEVDWRYEPLAKQGTRRHFMALVVIPAIINIILALIAYKVIFG
ncbi:Fumarylacetoacetate (FAA) hydrolase family [Carpediemonas membranifera]|uniref:Fumarylacetoacetate (FAA) hydrolase family n=1 Tax=Carpediemonas membranifera TaxID=201153 RepID=A0A8J6B5Q9_9EUKA|nr:Fumarylacetoacetate (FAA) hydrolase family [Carpediemonas membranifera]|eukprot:KAG9396228.1 Fumarylacetoacetate (FAA) hydrolase family [Carpediemonas membranifera]